MTQQDLEMITEIVLRKSTPEKIQLLEDAFDQSFGTFWQLADILLKAPCGDGGGLPTEVINEVFNRKNK